MPGFPEQITITEGFYLTDGGSIVLIAKDSTGRQYEITLSQHLILEYLDPKRPPGRLYFNHQLIHVRSEAEAQILQLIKACRIADDPEPPAPSKDLQEGGPGMIIGEDLKEYHLKLSEGKHAVLQHLVQMLIAYLESEDYLVIARRFSTPQAED